MTILEEKVRESISQKALSELLRKEAWRALLPIAVEMELPIEQISKLNFSPAELTNLIILTWREKVSRLTQCQKICIRFEKEKAKQQQVLMNFHLEEKI